MRETMRRILFAILMTMGVAAHAQMDSLLFQREHRLDSIDSGTLAIEVDNVTFFKDNEYDGRQVTGYTLPGLWIQPKVTYQANKNIKFEAGVHSLIYYGKRRYPNAAYQDIGAWKGNDYMEGTHLLPFFRANVQMGKVNVVLGDLYGGANHRLIQPLYCQELNLTSDPEKGVQVLVGMDRWHLDAWCDWQSFIFKGDTHQESFIFGGNSEVRLGRKWTIPLQVVVQHRGGEIQVDSAHHGVQTLINYSLGGRFDTGINTSWLKRVVGEAHFVGYLQQSGTLYHSGSGVGAYAQCALDFTPGIRFTGSYFRNHNYMSLLGSGQFNCVDAKDRTMINKDADIYTAAIEYSRTFGKYFAFGARGMMYFYNRQYGGDTVDLNFGVFVKINPRFTILKK